MGNLQCGEMRELVGGAAENLGEPLDSFLMRHVYEGAVAKDIRQAVRAVVRLRDLLRRPKVPVSTLHMPAQGVSQKSLSKK
jgi:hypothetical protein